MKSIHALVALILAGALTAPAAAGEKCSIALETAGRHAWTLEIAESRITGDKTSLEKDAGVVFGFLFGKPTRIRLQDDRLTGNLAGERITLHVERAGDQTVLRGPIGGLQSNARASADRLLLNARNLSITLKTTDPAESEKTTMADESGFVVMTFQGCDPAILGRRPELLLVVNWMIHNTDQELPIGPDPVPHDAAKQARGK